MSTTVTEICYLGLGGHSHGQVELAAGALLAQIDHAIQLVIRAEAPPALIGVVEGRRLHPGTLSFESLKSPERNAILDLTGVNHRQHLLQRAHSTCHRKCKGPLGAVRTLWQLSASQRRFATSTIPVPLCAPHHWAGRPAHSSRDQSRLIQLLR